MPGAVHSLNPVDLAGEVGLISIFTLTLAKWSASSTAFDTNIMFSGMVYGRNKGRSKRLCRRELNGPKSDPWTKII